MYIYTLSCSNSKQWSVDTYFLLVIDTWYLLLVIDTWFCISSISPSFTLVNSFSQKPYEMPYPNSNAAQPYQPDKILPRPLLRQSCTVAQLASFRLFNTNAERECDSDDRDVDVDRRPDHRPDRRVFSLFAVVGPSTVAAAFVFSGVAFSGYARKIVGKVLRSLQLEHGYARLEDYPDRLLLALEESLAFVGTVKCYNHR
ncbi:hypothetical protein PHJA_000809700 [Phtheirospermum japonicum]|uniref:Iron-sulphur binding protein LdpA C-terminal domain-containing protein n=1 Tax=Phtheirospermum japonicum TaxID=374723 RepID=A0A830BM98_9LAMI|nr:hypothetical protein PHJA_000809700 [Phtheirospermum japonicum]